MTNRIVKRESLTTRVTRLMDNYHLLDILEVIADRLTYCQQRGDEENTKKLNRLVGILEAAIEVTAEINLNVANGNNCIICTFDLEDEATEDEATEDEAA